MILPNEDGLSLLRRLKDQPETAETPVVLLTARAQAADQARGWDAGCTEYVTKPFSPNALARIVTRTRKMNTEDRRRPRDQALAVLAGSLRD